MPSWGKNYTIERAFNLQPSTNSLINQSLVYEDVIESSEVLLRIDSTQVLLVGCQTQAGFE